MSKNWSDTINNKRFQNTHLKPKPSQAFQYSSKNIPIPSFTTSTSTKIEEFSANSNDTIDKSNNRNTNNLENNLYSNNLKIGQIDNTGFDKNENNSKSHINNRYNNSLDSNQLDDKDDAKKKLKILWRLIIIMFIIILFWIYNKQDQPPSYSPSNQPTQNNEQLMKNEISKTQSTNSFPDVKINLNNEIQKVIKELLVDYHTIAVIYPVNIDISKLEDTVNKYGQHTNSYAILNRIQSDIKKMITTIKREQIESKINDSEEIRSITGNFKIDNKTKKLMSKQILNQLICDSILGLEGLKYFSISDDEINNISYQYEKRYAFNFNQWLKEKYGTIDQFKLFLKLELSKKKYTLKFQREQVYISKKEVIEYYSNNIDFFREPEQVEVAQIFLRTPSTSTYEEQKKIYSKMKRIMKSLKAGRRFSYLARKYSQDGNNQNNGVLGMVQKGELPLKIEKKIFNLKDGQISGILESTRGYHIFKAIKHHKKKTLSFNEVEKTIKNQLEKKQLNSLLGEHIKEISHLYITKDRIHILF